MGDKSEAFCRLALDVMTNSPGVLARDFDIEEMRRDLAAHDALRARSVRLQKLAEKVRDTDIALGSDVISAALEGYGMLKVASKSEGLSTLRRALSAHHALSAQGQLQRDSISVAHVRTGRWPQQRPTIQGQMTCQTR
ncbi:MAG: hypothetical protein ACREPV_07020 [Lysobacter sp.]